VYSLRDLADGRRDVEEEAVPLCATGDLPAAGGADAVVADLIVSLKGARAVCAAKEQGE
jgi:hypothetical protein